MRRRNRHAIAIHVGLVFLLYRATRQALTDPAVLRDYLSRRGLIAFRRAGLPKQLRVGTRFDERYGLNAERGEWLWQIFGAMLEHVFLHELAHALRGHLSYANVHAGLALLDERQLLRRYAEEAVRDVEIDADVHAVDMWAEVTLPGARRRRKKTLRGDILFQKLLSINLLYQLLHASGSRGARGDGHPPPIQRMILLANAITNTLRVELRLDREQAWAIWEEAGWEAHQIARSLGIPSRKWSISRFNQNAQQRLVEGYLTSAERRLDAYVETLPDSLV